MDFERFADMEIDIIKITKSAFKRHGMEVPDCYAFELDCDKEKIDVFHKGKRVVKVKMSEYEDWVTVYASKVSEQKEKGGNTYLSRWRSKA